MLLSEEIDEQRMVFTGKRYPIEIHREGTKKEIICFNNKNADDYSFFDHVVLYSRSGRW